jgi:hypothetical protein
MSELNAQDLLSWQKLHDWASAKPEGSDLSSMLLPFKK